MPSRRHCRQTGPIYLAKFLSPYLFLLQVRFTAMAGLLPAYYAWFPKLSYTLRFLGGRHPLCGMGVTSLMARTSIPAGLNARNADSRPEPGPDTRPSTPRSPLSLVLLVAVMGAFWGAEGGPFREPGKPLGR